MMEESSLSFNLVDTPEDTALFMLWLFDHLDVPISIDTETTGLEWWTPGFLRLVQFGCSDGTGWAIPYAWHSRLLHHALTLIRQAGTPVPMHNCKFDMHALESAGLPTPLWRNVHDTKVLHHLEDPLAYHSLKPISVERHGRWAGEGQAMLHQLMKDNSWSWGTVPVDHPIYWGYGVIDTVLTAELFDGLHHHTRTVPYDREMSYQRIMYSAEKRGLVIDVPYAEALRDVWERRAKGIAAHLYETFGISNANSNRQIEGAIKSLGWEFDIFTETGQAQLDKTIYERLMQEAGLVGEAAELLTEWKQITKWSSTYLEPFIASGGRVHASINTMQAKTGRSSITGPPLQTLPHTPEIRRAVLPYDEEQCIYAIDYSGQEYRILASLSGDPAWLQEFLEGDGDPHTLVANTVGIERGPAKNFNFAQVYGAGKQKLSDMTGLNLNQVESFLDIYDNRFPGIRRFKDKLEADTYNNSYKAMTAGGRVVQCHEDQLYAITNYVIQGSGADVLKEATCQLDAAGMGDYIMLPVHDELVFSFPKEDSAALAQECQGIMLNEWFDVPIVTEQSGPYTNWGEAYE